MTSVGNLGTWLGGATSKVYGREVRAGVMYGVRKRFLVPLVGAAIAWSVLLPAVADACSIHIIELDLVLASIEGEPAAEMGDDQIVGVVEMLVIGAWAETDTYRPASLAAPNLVWGEAPELSTVIHGGQPLIPDTTSSCTNDARRLGTRWWLGVFGADDGGPGLAVLIRPDADEDAQMRFTAAFGAPQSLETPTVPDRHPSEPAPGEATPTEPTTTAVATAQTPASAAPPTNGSDPSWVLVAVAVIALIALGLAIARRAQTSESTGPRREVDR